MPARCLSQPHPQPRAPVPRALEMGQTQAARRQGRQGRGHSFHLTSDLLSRRGSSSRRWQHTGRQPAWGQMGPGSTAAGSRSPGAGAMAALLPVLQGHEVEVCDLHWWPDLGREGDGGEGALLALLPRAHLCLGIQGVQPSPRQPPRWGTGVQRSPARPPQSGAQPARHRHQDREGRRPHQHLRSSWSAGRPCSPGREGRP